MRPRNVARGIGNTDRYRQSRKDRKKVEMLFAHLKRILNLTRLRLRGLNNARDEFLLAAIAQNLQHSAEQSFCHASVRFSPGAMVVYALRLGKKRAGRRNQRQLPGRKFSTVTDKRFLVARDEVAGNDAAPGSLEHYRWKPQSTSGAKGGRRLRPMRSAAIGAAREPCLLAGSGPRVNGEEARAATSSRCLAWQHASS
jgi:hypothetical protein